MSYQDQPIKKTHNGSELVQLSVGKEIVEIRSRIEDMKVQHAGPELELLYQAYCEIQRAHAHQPIKLDPTCSGCIMTMKKLLINWFKLYDKGTVPMKAKYGGVKPKPLQPIKEKKAEKLPAMEPNRNEAEIKAKVAEDLSNKGKGEAKKKEPTYAELFEKFKKVATAKEKEEINNGKNPSKKQIVEYFNKNN